MVWNLDHFYIDYFGIVLILSILNGGVTIIVIVNYLYFPNCFQTDLALIFIISIKTNFHLYILCSVNYFLISYFLNSNVNVNFKDNKVFRYNLRNILNNVSFDIR